MDHLVVAEVLAAGIGIGIGTSGSRSSASSAKYQYAMRHYQDAADPLTGDAAYKDYNRYENPMNDAHVRDGGAADAGGVGGGGMPMAEYSVRRRMQEVQSLGGVVGGAGAGGGGGSGILAGAPTFESLMSMECGGQQTSGVGGGGGGGGNIGPTSSRQQRGYISPSDSAHDVHHPSAAKSVSFDNDHNMYLR